MALTRQGYVTALAAGGVAGLTAIYGTGLLALSALGEGAEATEAVAYATGFGQAAQAAGYLGAGLGVASAAGACSQGFTHNCLASVGEAAVGGLLSLVNPLGLLGVAADLGGIGLDAASFFDLSSSSKECSGAQHT
jgi:hypothetical protein